MAIKEGNSVKVFIGKLQKFGVQYILPPSPHKDEDWIQGTVVKYDSEMKAYLIRIAAGTEHWWGKVRVRTGRMI